MKRGVVVSLVLLTALCVWSPINTYAMEIIGYGSGRCVDMTYPAVAGSRAQLYDCHGIFNQVWKYNYGSFQGPNFMCLDVYNNGTADGTKVQLWPCNNTAAQKFWVDQYGRIRHTYSGKCVDAIGYGTGNGTPLQIWSCHGGTNQRWVLQK